MLTLETDLQGQMAEFGLVRKCIRGIGYHMGGNWDYHQGYFDRILCQEGGETIYVRLPFSVVEGELDHYEAIIRFRTPYIIKHVVHIGLDRDETSMLNVAGFNQFQPPIDQDGKITNKDRWIHAGETAVGELMDCLHAHNLLEIS